MLERYSKILKIAKENQLAYSRGYAILERMKKDLNTLNQKKKSLKMWQ